MGNEKYSISINQALGPIIRMVRVLFDIFLLILDG